MKKLTLIISALALVLGMSQCTKKPNQPVFGSVEPSTKTITFTTDGGAKGGFDQNGGLLNYAWDKNSDVLHVYLQNTASENYTGGTYLGEMHIISVAGKYSATFEGTFTAPFSDEGWIRFVHCGSGITVTDGGTEYVDFSTQDGDKATVSSKVVAVCDQKITEDCTFKFEECNLMVQFGVVKFSFQNFTDKTMVVLSGIEENKLKVNIDGTVSYGAGSLSSLNNVNNEYYTVFMPKLETKYKFTGGTRFANSKKSTIVAGKFYTDEATGTSIILNLMPEGSVSGKYSVSSSKQVYFSNGNLQYIGSAEPPYWKFADNQWDVIGTAQGNDYENQDRDLFGWATSGHQPTNDSHFLYYRPWDTYRTDDGPLHETNYFGYGPSNDKTPDGPAGGTIIGDITNSYFDWGVENAISNGGNVANMWRTMTSSEWEYLLARKSSDNKFMSYPCRVKVGENYENGYLILSDDNEDLARSQNVYASWEETPSFETMPEDAAFLPMAGYRKRIEVSDIGAECRYQSTTHSEPEDHKGGRYNFNAFLRYDGCSVDGNPRAYGRSVRLVQNYN